MTSDGLLPRACPGGTMRAMATRSTPSDSPARVATDALLWGGVVGAIAFVVVFLVEGVVRSGYDPVRLAVSFLSLGEGGWVQVATFLVTGVLVITFAAGVRRVLRGGLGATGVPVAIAVAGAGLVIAGLFSTMPAFGYPPGTPEGFPTQIPTTAYLHVLGALCFFGGLVVAPVLMARRLRSDGARDAAVGSVVVAVVVLVFFGASSADSSGEPFFPTVAGLLQRVSIVAGLGWLAWLGLRLLRIPVEGD
jgi:protein-S-isoprenylcysteine O-methyltransferase Ste14